MKALCLQEIGLRFQNTNNYSALNNKHYGKTYVSN